MASTFGQLFRITTWGESHGGGVGVVVDGCPPRLKLDRGGHPAGFGSPPSGAIQNRHAAQGIGHGANPFRHVRRQNARHADLSLGQKRGRAARSVFGNEGPNSARRTRTSLISPNTASAPGRAADAPARAKQLAASPPARSPKKFCAKDSASRLWPTSSKSKRFPPK